MLFVFCISVFFIFINCFVILFMYCINCGYCFIFVCSGLYEGDRA